MRHVVCLTVLDFCLGTSLLLCGPLRICNPSLLRFHLVHLLRRWEGVETSADEYDGRAGDHAHGQRIPKQPDAQQEAREFANVQHNADGKRGGLGGQPVDADDAEELGCGVQHEEEHGSGDVDGGHNRDEKVVGGRTEAIRKVLRPRGRVLARRVERGRLVSCTGRLWDGADVDKLLHERSDLANKVR